MQGKKRARPVGIGVKTMVSHVMLAVFVVLIASVFSYLFTLQYIREVRVRDLTSKAQYIAESVAARSEGMVMPDRRTMRFYQDMINGRVFFLDADSDAIRVHWYSMGSDEDGDGQGQWMEVSDSIDQEYAARILNGETVSAVQRFEFAEGEILLAGVPMIDSAGTVYGGVMLTQPAEQLYDLLRTIGLVLAGVVAVSLMLAVVLALDQTRKLVKPIQRLTDAARRMANGTYAERITALPDDEIGELGRALNSMSEHLVDVIRNLRKERDKLELVVSGIGEGLIAVDTDWRIVHVNTAFRELLEIERFYGFSPDDAPEILPVRALVGRCMETEQAEHAQWRNASGRALYAAASALKDEDGALQGVVCLLRDVSEAQRAEQLRRDYVANISHELRTPLTGIRGMVEPLIDGILETEDEKQESYRVILKESIRLEKLVGEMLDLSRLQDGRITVELEPLELPGILEAAVESMQPIADGAGVRLDISTDGSALACLGNEGRIMQVLVILMDNALSFTPAGGRVTVFARDDGARVALGVRDTGCGIEPKDLPLIWERFYKADKSRMRTTGTGLGLSIAKLVVELMGGEIGVKSEPGQGAEFTFTLQKE